jgi:Fur family peroxide stress response transcriptional regulator
MAPAHARPASPPPAADTLALPRGRRLTPRRRLVYGTLASVDSHPDAEQLIELVRRRDRGVSVATVYNTLRLLVEAGAVLELRGLGPKVRYDANIGEHDHFTCRICGTVEDIPRQWPVPERLAGAGLEDHSVEDVAAHIRGVCGRCASEPSTP